MTAHSPNVPAGSAPRPLITPFEFPDFQVSWAGRGPLGDHFCFGSEDGKLLLTTEEGEDPRLLPETTPAGEAVNGVAFLNDHMAVSTRSDIAFLKPRVNQRKGSRAVFDAGAHGVVASRSGYFVAPLGPMGLLQVKPEAGPDQRIVVSRLSQEVLNFYKVASLPAGDSDVLACAVRYGGVAVTVLPSRDRQRTINSLTYPGLDVVDVCPLGVGLETPALGAVGRDGTLILSRDVARDRRPVTLKFDDIPGTAYRLFSSQGHLFLLTSSGMYVLAGLARRFLDGESVDSQCTAVRGLQFEAVDANLSRDRWLLVVLTDKVLRIDLSLLAETLPTHHPLEETGSLAPTLLSPEWEDHDEWQAVDAEAILAPVGKSAILQPHSP